MGAYLIGRIHAGSIQVPLAIALLNGPAGIVIDAILLGEDDLSILFSFTRSHFHVDVDFWRRTQDKIRAGELPQIFPYSLRCRLKRNQPQ